MVEVCTRGVDTGFVALGYAKVALLGVVQGNHRVTADFIHRAHAAGASGARLAGPRFGPPWQACADIRLRTTARGAPR
jgi:hypothetical protein